MRLAASLCLKTRQLLVFAVKPARAAQKELRLYSSSRQYSNRDCSGTYKKTMANDTGGKECVATDGQ